MCCSSECIYSKDKNKSRICGGFLEDSDTQEEWDFRHFWSLSVEDEQIYGQFVTRISTEVHSNSAGTVCHLLVQPETEEATSRLIRGGALPRVSQPLPSFPSADPLRAHTHKLPLQPIYSLALLSPLISAFPPSHRLDPENTQQLSRSMAAQRGHNG